VADVPSGPSLDSTPPLCELKKLVASLGETGKSGFSELFSFGIDLHLDQKISRKTM
jgi:hypothetical protein